MKRSKTTTNKKMHRVVTNYAPVEGGGSSNISVFIRARPLEDPTEQSDFLQVGEEDERKIVIRDPDSNSNKRYAEVSFQFDRIFWTQTQQAEIFEQTCKEQVEHVLNGYNCCCFACKSQLTVFFHHFLPYSLHYRWSNRIWQDIYHVWRRK
jgi:hypothetical protein